MYIILSDRKRLLRPLPYRYDVQISELGQDLGPSLITSTCHKETLNWITPSFGKIKKKKTKQDRIGQLNDQGT